MEYLVGIGLAAAVAVFAARAGFDRDRAFYPTVLIIVASYYGLFAVMGGSVSALGLEVLVTGAFVGLAVIGFRTSLWLVVAGLAGHGVLDLFHHGLIANPGVPAWWPGFCSSYDVLAAGALAWRLSRPGGLQAGTGRAAAARPLVEAELLAAINAEASGDAAEAFRRLERAHILGQAFTGLHVKVHVRMLGWSVRQHDGREFTGQIFRIGAAALFTPFGLVPRGNTGGADVSPFRAAPIPDDLARSLGPLLGCVLAVGLAFYGNGGNAAPAPVRSAQVEGRTVAYSVFGSGRPVVVFITGLGDDMATFKDVAPEIAKGATVITYDRSGYGGSAGLGGARDAVRADRELLDLLAQSGVPGPYILAGHSIGGLYAEYFAASHPDKVAGLILEESRPADFGRRCQAIGAEPCTPTPAMVAGSPAGIKDDVAGLEALFAQVAATAPNKAIPVLILSRPIAANAKPFDKLWGEAQNDLAARYPGATHLTAPGGGHYIHKDEKTWFVTTVQTWLKGPGAGGTKP